ncbi:kinase-like protein, partial [Gyrodon lividus]
MSRSPRSSDHSIVNLSKKFIGAVKDDWQLLSDRSQDYTIGSPIGFGASSVVYAAIYNPPSPEPHRPFPCALKVLDLDSLPPHSFVRLQRETQLMSLSKHPNVLRVRGSWVDGHMLYIALRLMNKGSAADVMQYGWPGGMEEEVVKCILKQALQGLNYLHTNGFIHRDIKAANLLIDDDGTVLVGDLGVSAPLADNREQSTKHSTSSGVSELNHVPMSTPKSSKVITPLSRPQMGKRKSFVGTPCWMAPELVQGKRYDAKVDIWSFGITAVELTQGRPPRSRESAHTILLQIVQGKPPTLDREGGVYHYSGAFKDIVDACLVKDPSKRPTAAELLQTSFFKSAKKKSHLVGAILDKLPPLIMRQERRRRLASLMTHRTMDSWDFGSTTAGSGAPSI